jgi:hypothetical protein
MNKVPSASNTHRAPRFSQAPSPKHACLSVPLGSPFLFTPMASTGLPKWPHTQIMSCHGSRAGIPVPKSSDFQVHPRDKEVNDSPCLWGGDGSPMEHRSRKPGFFFPGQASTLAKPENYTFHLCHTGKLRSR